MTQTRSEGVPDVGRGWIPGRGQGHPSVLRGHLRHGPAAAASALIMLLTVAAFVQLLVRDGPPAHSDTTWQAAMELTDPVLSVAAGLACWQGGAYVRSRTQWLRVTASRPPLSADALAFAPGVLWPLAGLAPVLATALCIAPAPTPSSPSGYVPPVIMATNVIAFACAGHLVGRVLPVRMTPLVVVVGLLLVAVMGTFLTSCTAGGRCETSYDSILLPHAALIATVPAVLRPWYFSGLNLVIAAVCVLLCARRWFPAAVVAAVPVVVLAPPLTALTSLLP